MFKYLSIFCVFFYSAFQCQIQAQALNGVYTVGTPSSDYPDLDSAVHYLNTHGINGAVEFAIEPGVYQESVTIDSIQGADSLNTVTFRSLLNDSSTVLLESSAPNQSIVFFLNQADHVVIRHLSFRYVSTSQLLLISMSNGHGNLISNNFFLGSSLGISSGPSKATIRLFSGLRGCRNNIIRDNMFFDGQGATYLDGTTTNSSYNNHIIGNSFVNTGMVYAERTRALYIKDNVSKAGSIAISVCEGPMVIERNRVTLAGSSSRFLSITNSPVDASLPIIVKNNFINLDTTVQLAAGSGFSLINSPNIKLLNNSLNQVGGIRLHNSQNVDFLNNAFSDSRGFRYVASDTSSLSTFHCDYNLYSSSQLELFSVDSNPNIYFDLAGWNTNYQKDLNSVVGVPFYTSLNNLHSNNGLDLKGNGFALSEVPYDIDGEIRGTAFCDIGADEFLVDTASLVDLGIVNVISPDSSLCFLGDTVSLAIMNRSPNQISSLVLKWWIYDSLQDSIIINQTIAAGDTAEIFVAGYDFNYNTPYELRFQLSDPNGQPDNYTQNDAYFVNLLELRPNRIQLNANELCSNDRDLSVPIVRKSTIMWSSGSTDPWLNIPSGPGVYSCVRSQLNGCTVTSNITVN